MTYNNNLGVTLTVSICALTLVFSMWTTPHMTFSDYAMMSISLAVWMLVIRNK